MCSRYDDPTFYDKDEEVIPTESQVIAQVIAATATDAEKEAAAKRPLSDLEREDLMAAIEFDLL